jgi:hypothetical protein
MKSTLMADVARVSTTAVVVPMDLAEDEVVGAVVDQVTTDEEVITGEAVEVEADTMVGLPLPSAQDQASRTSTSCAILPPSLVSS